MILKRLVQFLAVVGAPTVQDDEQRDGFARFLGSVKEGGLFGAIQRTLYAYLTDLSGKESRQQDECSENGS